MLDNPVHHDAWGSVSAIPTLLGRPSDGRPQSELWMGAHPASPSRIVRADAPSSMLDAVRAEPERMLGRAVLEAYGTRLPFLLKVLAADRPLSLQAHPSRAQASAGYAAEERQGLALDDPRRNYVDAHHKPELLCALTDFDVLCGFRPPAATVRLLDRLPVAALAEVRDALAAHPDATGVGMAVAGLLRLPHQDRAPVVAAVGTACAEVAASEDPDAALARTVAELAEAHPGDPGVLCTLLMHRATLQPGQAVFLDAGNLHAYLRGLGVEVMAASDNVLRGGLTVRRVDVDELLSILNTTPGPLPLVEPVRRGEVEHAYPVPVPDFRLSRLDLTSGRSYDVEPGVPRIMLVTDGVVEVAQAGRRARLDRGQVGFFPAADPEAALTGDGTAFLATTTIPGSGAAG